ncbi:MAG: lysophospholipid acyltransferase family protein [Geminicoccaceae bacterium]|nr:lysophospholipid acyltransferase family protein [Geminicoccaceae bacterium]
MPTAAALAAYIRLVDRSGRFDLRADPATVELVRSRRPFIGVFWHGRMMMIQPAWRRLVAGVGLVEPLRPCVIGSDHADAVLVSDVMRRLDLDTLHGSNKRGGLAIFRNALRVLGAGRIAVLTPDGPRGPARRAKPGVIHLARRAGVPIVPISFTATPVWRLRSWDGFLVPLPFARGVLAFGPPLHVRPADDPESLKLELERAIDRLDPETDRVRADPLAASRA